MAACEKELAEQYAAGKWLKRDMKADALKWAKRRSASMKIEDLPARIGGRLMEKDGQAALELLYFNEHIIITDRITKSDGSALTRYEQVFIHIHMAQGGSARHRQMAQSGGNPQHRVQSQIHGRARGKTAH
ncbi:MAG: hypothetical protein R2860_05330 [Desulfobacterales bacterium]